MKADSEGIHAMTAPVTRPGLVTLVAALTVIAGIVAIIAGVIAMVAEGTFLGAGLVSVVIGLIYLAVAKGLADGNSVSRAIVAIVSVLQIAWVVYRMIAVDSQFGVKGAGIGSAVVSLAGSASYAGLSQSRWLPGLIDDNNRP